MLCTFNLLRKKIVKWLALKFIGSEEKHTTLNRIGKALYSFQPLRAIAFTADSSCCFVKYIISTIHHPKRPEFHSCVLFCGTLAWFHPKTCRQRLDLKHGISTTKWNCAYLKQMSLLLAAYNWNFSQKHCILWKANTKFLMDSMHKIGF